MKWISQEIYFTNRDKLLDQRDSAKSREDWRAVDAITLHLRELLHQYSVTRHMANKGKGVE